MTQGVELPCGLILFGAPHDKSHEPTPAAWLGGLTADKYERIIREAQP